MDLVADIKCVASPDLNVIIDDVYDSTSLLEVVKYIGQKHGIAGAPFYKGLLVSFSPMH